MREYAKEKTEWKWLLRFLLVLISSLFLMAAAAQAYTVHSGSGSWKRKGRYYIYVLENGKAAHGWYRIGKSTYYFNRRGYRVTWLKKIGGKYYYFSTRGRLKTGWIVISGRKYYFNPKRGGARARGSVLKGNTVYVFSKSGVFRRSYNNGTLNWVGRDGYRLYRSTIKKLLRTALKPLGSTLYVWGGGWNEAQTAADETTRRIGLNPQWKTFYDSQNAAYNYRYYRYRIKDGLDCSGYIGWVIYNTFNRKNGRAGYVMKAASMARTFSSYGWGSYTTAASVKDFKAGDIMSSSGHVYLVVGPAATAALSFFTAAPAESCSPAPRRCPET